MRVLVLEVSVMVWELFWVCEFGLEGGGEVIFCLGNYSCHTIHIQASLRKVRIHGLLSIAIAIGICVYV